ncbi:MAG TPA: hypothetical protein VLG39_02705 [Nitrospirota bacterium]|nr:hypothetical protein [Nitrospirota bacterium]
MAVEIGEPITVGAVFSRGAVKPVWFDWNGRRVRIRQIALAWSTREGRSGILHYSVTDGQGLYEIGYHTGTLAWRLIRSCEA